MRRHNVNEKSPSPRYSCLPATGNTVVSSLCAAVPSVGGRVSAVPCRGVCSSRLCTPGPIAFSTHRQPVLLQLRIQHRTIFTCCTMDPAFHYYSVKKSADFILSKTKHRPRIGIVCGSGLGVLVDLLEQKDVLPFSEIPNCPVSTVHGHAGRLVAGLLRGVAVLCLQGRAHMYEGYPVWKTAVMIRVMRLAGVEHVILTNAAGALNADYRVGDVMLIKDHISMPNMAGQSPLVGPNDDKFGVRFPGMSNAYDIGHRRIAQEVAKEMRAAGGLREGVYAMVGGPSYETVAELRLLKMVGADAVGMSTVAETVVARHCGMRVLAFSVITNQCVMDWDTEREANHAEVLEAGRRAGSTVMELVARLVARIGEPAADS